VNGFGCACFRGRGAPLLFDTLSNEVVAKVDGLHFGQELGISHGQIRKHHHWDGRISFLQKLSGRAAKPNKSFVTLVLSMCKQWQRRSRGRPTGPALTPLVQARTIGPKLRRR
jgi:hypothetical protein